MKKMKKIVRALCIISAAAMIAILYVALQVELYRTSYSIHKNKEVLTQVQDDFEQKRIRLFKAKALDILESKIEAAKVPLTLPSEVMTLHVRVPESKIGSSRIESDKQTFSLLQFVREAHAKIISSDRE